MAEKGKEGKPSLASLTLVVVLFGTLAVLVLLPLPIFNAVRDAEQRQLVAWLGHETDQWIKQQDPTEELARDLTEIAPSSQLLTAAEPPARPIRQASQVMRIWVAPWVDSTDNLNWATHIYTEVTPKRWSYGEQEVRHQGMPAGFIPR